MKDKYSWHNLNENPNDLPENTDEVLVAFNRTNCISYQVVSYYEGFNCCMELDGSVFKDYEMKDVDFWKYIEQPIIKKGENKMSKLEQAKKVVKENIHEANCGIFDSRNLVGDYMETLYDEDGLQIDICRGWAYFEVFGLTKEEFENLKDFYNGIAD